MFLTTPDERVSFRQTHNGYVVTDTHSGASKRISGRNLFYAPGGSIDLTPGTPMFNERAVQDFDGSVETSELLAAYLNIFPEGGAV